MNINSPTGGEPRQLTDRELACHQAYTELTDHMQERKIAQAGTVVLDSIHLNVTALSEHVYLTVDRAGEQKYPQGFPVGSFVDDITPDHLSATLAFELTDTEAKVTFDDFNGQGYLKRRVSAKALPQVAALATMAIKLDPNPTPLPTVEEQLVDYIDDIT